MEMRMKRTLRWRETLKQQITRNDNQMTRKTIRMINDYNQFKMTDQFYGLSTLSQIKINSSSFNNAFPLANHNGTHYISIRRDKRLWDIIAVTADTSRIIIHSLKGQPMHLDFTHSLILLATSDNKLVCQSFDPVSFQSKGEQFFETFKKLKFSVDLTPNLEAVLLFPKCEGKEFLIFMKEARQLIANAPSLSQILQPYTSVTCLTSHQGMFSVGCYSAPLRQYHVLVIVLKNSPQQQGKKQFTLVDCVKLKQGKVLNQIQFVEEGEELLICYQGSKIMKTNVNTEGVELFRRKEVRVMHSFNFFCPRSLVLLANRRDIIVQDSNGALTIIGMFGVKGEDTQNKFYIGNDSQSRNQKLVIFNDSLLAISQSSFDQATLNVEGLILKSFDEIITELLSERGDQFVALQMMRKTGLGRLHYLKYQLKQTHYSEYDKVQEYLSQTDLTAQQLYQILRTEQIDSVRSFIEILNKAISISDHQRLLQTLLIARSRVALHQELFTDALKLTISDFCFALSMPKLITQVVLGQMDSPEQIRDSIKIIYTSLEIELAINYEECLLCIPLQFIDNSFLLKYLPPGQERTTSTFWKIMASIDQNRLNDPEIYKKVALRCINEAEMPGKALIILQEGAQKRGIIGLTDIAMLAVENIFAPMSQGEGEFSLKGLLDNSFDAHERDVIKLQDFFEKAKWIFVMDHQQYLYYISSLKNCLDKAPEQSLALLKQILQYHSSTKLLFLRDQDLAQFVINYLYSDDSITILHWEILLQIYDSINELSLSQNQDIFVRQCMSLHVQTLAKFLYSYQVKVSLRQLLLVQSENEQVPQLKRIISDMIDYQIQKSKDVKEKVLQLSQQSKEKKQLHQTKWARLLSEVRIVKDTIGKNIDIDVYSLFMRKLLDNKVTASIDQLIMADIVPIDQLQSSVLSYLQDQYNTCDKEKFYSFAQNSKNFLELLLKKKQWLPIKQELSLLECSFFLKQNNLLMDSLSNQQVRNDFNQGRLVDRVLQVHGFDDFHDTMQVLGELQHIIDSSSMPVVIIKVLKHLNQTKQFETASSRPLYTEQLLTQMILSKRECLWLNDDYSISDILYKISLTYKEDNQKLRKKILICLLDNCDRKRDLYYTVCSELIQLIKPTQQQDELITALASRLENKARYLIKQRIGNLYDKKQAFISLTEDMQLPHQLRKFLAKILELNADSIDTISSLKDSQSVEDFITHFTTGKPQQINQNPKAQAVQSPSQQETQHDITVISQLISSETIEDANLVIDMEYCDWNGDFSLDKFIVDVGTSQIPIIVLEAVVSKLASTTNPRIVDQLENIKALYLNEQTLNVLIVIKDLNVGCKDQLINELKRVVTDFNYIKLTLLLEKLDEDYSGLLSLALYQSKVDIAMKHIDVVQTMQPIQVEQILYQFTSKDSLEEYISYISAAEQEIIMTNKGFLDKVKQMNINLKKEIVEAILIELS